MQYYPLHSQAMVWHNHHQPICGNDKTCWWWPRWQRGYWAEKIGSKSTRKLKWQKNGLLNITKKLGCHLPWWLAWQI